MISEISGLEDVVANLLQMDRSGIPSRILIEDKVRKIAAIQEIDSEEVIQLVVKKLEERFNVTMSLGVLFARQDHRPWLDGRRGDIEWYYSERYKRYLGNNKYPNNVLTSMDMITDRILDHIENPEKPGRWASKGLVVGHVQSGKTANYIGVICKAADAGYKAIIVMAGVLNSLRNQTQVRIEDGFTGVDSIKRFSSNSLYESFTGAGIYSAEHIPVTLTTRVEDFKKQIAAQLGAELSSFNEPVVLVIKKESSILKNLVTWIKGNALNLESLPLLLIDDEADQASINTKKSGSEVTTINRNIRKLLSLFSQSAYIGYTATPFANIFIDPESRDDMLGDELFPRDFIVSLEPPTNYVGPNRIFGEESDLDVVREVSDYGDLIPIIHRIDLDPPELPQSLMEAVRVFILARAVRLRRGHIAAHNSMLVNISRFTAVQTKTAILLNEYLTELRNAIVSSFALPGTRALKSSFMSDILGTWEKEFPRTEFEWSEIQSILKDAVSPVSVIEVNSSRTSQPMDYSLENYPQGRNVIAVGGFSLSRGLTLEGLAVSYILRSTKMYDTLLQMGRWFGYRHGYDDLCRIYMPAESSAWYRYISGVTDELRGEFKKMSDMKMTPADFGLAVRTHPDSLIITARNKMRTGRKILKKIDLVGRLVETHVIGATEQVIENNFKVFNNLISELESSSNSQQISQGYLYDCVQSDIVEEFVAGFNNHPASLITESKPLSEHIHFMKTEQGISLWDVLLVSPQKLRKDKNSPVSHSSGKISIKAQWRKVARERGSAVIFNKSRVGSRAHELAGLTSEQKNELKRKYGTLSKVPPDIVRECRIHPLLMVHLVDCREHKSDQEPIFQEGAIAFGISFPGQSEKGRARKLVEYMVNTVWWNSEYADTLDVEEEIDE